MRSKLVDFPVNHASPMAPMGQNQTDCESGRLPLGPLDEAPRHFLLPVNPAAVGTARRADEWNHVDGSRSAHDNLNN